MLADDQIFRLTSLAFTPPDGEADRRVLVAAMRRAGLNVTVNNLWILGWIGAYDKLAMARRAMADAYNIDIDAGTDAVLYCGDSTNDAPMFAFFRHTVGVSSVRRFLPEIPIPPNWITKGPGGDGFVEVAGAVIASKIISWRYARGSAPSHKDSMTLKAYAALTASAARGAVRVVEDRPRS